MNTKTLKTLAALSLAVAGLLHGAIAHADDNGTPMYVSPGIGTLVVGWLSTLF